MVNQSFPRSLRLLSSAAYDAVFKQPQRAATRQISLLGCRNQLEHPRLGIIVAKRNVRRAWQRNRFKRIVRENFRQRQHQLSAMDFLIIAKKGVDELDNQSISKLLNVLWQRHCRPL